MQMLRTYALAFGSHIRGISHPSQGLASRIVCHKPRTRTHR